VSAGPIYVSFVCNGRASTTVQLSLRCECIQSHGVMDCRGPEYVRFVGMDFWPEWAEAGGRAGRVSGGLFGEVCPVRRYGRLAMRISEVCPVRRYGRLNMGAMGAAGTGKYVRFIVSSSAGRSGWATLDVIGSLESVSSWQASESARCRLPAVRPGGPVGRRCEPASGANSGQPCPVRRYPSWREFGPPVWRFF
jgi:hypothetical protein